MDASLSFDAVTAAGSADQPSDQYPSQTLFSVHIFVDRNHTALQRLLAQLDAADSTGIRDNIELHLHMALDAPVKVVKAVHAALWRHGTKRIDVRMARDDLPSIVAARWPSGSPYALVLDETASVSPAALQYARWCVKVFLERPPFHLGSQLAGCNLVTQPHVAATLGYWPGSSDSRRNIAASRLVYSASVPASGVLARKAIWRDFSTEFADWKRLLDSAHETDPRSSVLARRVLLGEYVPFAASSGHAFEDVPAPTTQPLWMSRHFFVALNIPENRTFVLDTAAEAHDAPRELFGRQEVADLLVTLPATTEERGSIESKMPQLTKYGLVAPQYLTRAE
nr:hypothetical protein HK105_002379 [Polyrhizophydium stewartii]